MKVHALLDRARRVNPEVEFSVSMSTTQVDEIPVDSQRIRRYVKDSPHLREALADVKVTNEHGNVVDVSIRRA